MEPISSRYRRPTLEEFKRGFKFEHFMRDRWVPDHMRIDPDNMMIEYFGDCLKRGVIRVKKLNWIETYLFSK